MLIYCWELILLLGNHWILIREIWLIWSIFYSGEEQNKFNTIGRVEFFIFIIEIKSYEITKEELN